MLIPGPIGYVEGLEHEGDTLHRPRWREPRRANVPAAVASTRHPCAGCRGRLDRPEHDGGQEGHGEEGGREDPARGGVGGALHSAAVFTWTSTDTRTGSGAARSKPGKN